MPDELHIILQVDKLNEAVKNLKPMGQDRDRLMAISNAMNRPWYNLPGGGPARNVAHAQEFLDQARNEGSNSDVFDALFKMRQANARFIKAHAYMATMNDPDKTGAYTAGQLNRAMRPRSIPPGPAARLRAAHANLQYALSVGSPDQIADAHVALAAAQKVQQRASMPDPGARNNFFGRAGLTMTRGGIGFILRGGINLATIFENLGVKAGISAAGLVGLYIAIKEANKEVREFTNAQTVSGGTTGDIATLRALGIKPSAQGAAADRLYDALTRDEFAIQAATKLGIGMQVPGPWGNQNHAQILRQTLEQLRIVGKMEGAEEQLRLARMLHLETMIDELRVSDSLWSSRNLTASISNHVEGLDVQQRFRDFSSGWDNMLDSLKLLGVSIADLVIVPITQLMQGVGAVFGLAAELIHGTFMGAVLSLHAIAGALGLEHGYDYEAAMKTNTQATQDNTAQMAKAGVYGTPGSMGAIPGYLKAEAYRGALPGATITFGAFAV